MGDRAPEPRHHTGPPAADARRAGIIDAADRCFARWGITKTAVDDIARDAGVSRATVYRYFAGGKDELVEAVVLHHEARFHAELGPRLDACATLGETLTVAIREAVTHLRRHPLLDTLARLEPERLLEHLAFDRIGPLLVRTTAFLAPTLERFLPPADAAAVAEWATRAVLSYWLQPSPHLDPGTTEGAYDLVHRFLLPGLGDSVTAVDLTATEVAAGSGPDAPTEPLAVPILSTTT